MLCAYCLVVKLSSIIHIPDSKPTTVHNSNHKLRIHHPLALWSCPCWSQPATLLRGIEYTVVHFHQCIWQPPSLPLLVYIMISMVGQVLFKLHFSYIYTSPAGKLTQLSLIAIQVVCNIYNTTLQPGRSHGLVCMHALYYIMLLEKSGVLQTCQHCNKQEYNGI